MALNMERLEAEVGENTNAVDSAVLLLDKLATELRDNAGDPDAINRLADALDASGNNLADAVARNTPAEEPAPTE